MNRYLLCLMAIFLGQGFAGCAKVGPDFLKPETVSPVVWHAPLEKGLHSGSPEPQALAQWWTILDDPLLTAFMHQAATDNLDLRQAGARLFEARARRDISAAGLAANLDTNAFISRSQSSSNRGSGTLSTSYSSGFDAGWELDLFGGMQRSLEVAQAGLAASEEDLRDILISLLSEVALSYIEVRSTQVRLEILTDNLAAQEESLALNEARYQSGLISELALQQTKYLVASTQAQIPNLITGLNKAKNNLAILLGRPPGTFNELLQNKAGLPALPSSVAVGIPAETLQRRPDIRKAEQLLAAQTAQIGVATAELYPSITLSGSIGLDALSAGKLFTADSGSYSFGPSIKWRLFDGGATKANIRLQTFLQEEAAARYKAVVLSALEEVEAALAAYAQEQDRHQALLAAASAAEHAVMLADLQFQAGLLIYTEVLDARRSLLSFQDQLATSQATMIGNFIRLYKALGGGWETLLLENKLLGDKQTP